MSKLFQDPVFTRGKFFLPIENGDSSASSGLVFDGLLTQIRNDGFNIVDVSSGGGAPLTYVTIQKLLFSIEKAGGRR